MLDWATEREEILHQLKGQLLQARARMKKYAGMHRQERSFVIGDLVYLKLQPYRQQTMVLCKKLKLSKRYYGPYKIIQRVGKVAYKLELPATSKIHPVFHVSQLKKVIKREDMVLSTLPSTNNKGTSYSTPSSNTAT